MCNFYAIYLKHPGSAYAYKDFLRKNALANGVQYILYPRLSELPNDLKRANFGIQHLNFLGILYYPGDAAYFPDSFKWPGVILEHYYSQDKESEEFVKGRVNQFKSMPRVSVSTGVVRPRSSVYGRVMYSSNVERSYYMLLDEYNNETQDIEDLLLEHKEAKMTWRAEHGAELARARMDEKDLDSRVRRYVLPLVETKYDFYKRMNPGCTRNVLSRYYAALFKSEVRKAKSQPPFVDKYRAIESLMATRPRKSADLKKLIAEHKMKAEKLASLKSLMDRE